MPNGLAVGEVTPHSAILWSRCDRPARLHVEVREGERARHASVETTASADFTGKLTFEGLSPGQRHEVLAWCSEVEDDSPRPRAAAAPGRFTTAPDAADARAVRFAFGGDVGGQNVCRDLEQGYPIFDTLSRRAPDFFIALGDMIYADTPCLARGAWGNAQVPRESRVATTLEQFHAHWRYNREDPHLKRFLSHTPTFAVWDDHEVVNDFGPKTARRRGVELMPAALRAMLDYNPLPQAERLYRHRRWGRHVELFFLDTRSYRDPNTMPDSERRPKQLLGREQVDWLLASLAASDATWKFVISGVPLSVPTGLNRNARDGFANYGGPTGFEHELRGLLEEMRRRGLNHTVWLTTDVHIAAGFHYVPFPETPEFELFEFISGPMSAGFFPRDVFDPTFHPSRLFTWAVEGVSRVRTYEAAKELFNYGELAIDASGRLRVEIINALGTRVRGVEVMESTAPRRVSAE